MSEVEKLFVESFVKKESRERALFLLASERHRRKFCNRLGHVFHEDLDSRFAYDEANVPTETAQQVEKTLNTWKQKNPQQLCHIIAASSTKDGQMMRLDEIATDFQLTFGAIIIVIPDKLAYYRTERSNISREPFYVLFRP